MSGFSNKKNNRYKWIKYALCLVIFFACKKSYAQPFVDLLSLKYSYTPKTSFRNYPAYQSAANQVSAELFAPIKVNAKNMIILGGVYDQINFKVFHNDIKMPAENDRLYQASFQAGIIKSVAKKWKMTLLAIPKISQSGKPVSFDQDGFQMGGAALFTYEKTRRLKFRAGIYYNREFFGNFFMPLLGIDYKIGDRMYLFGVLPGSMNFEYRIAKGFYTGLAYKSITASYRFDATHYIREGDPFWGHNVIRNFYHYYIAKQIVLMGEIGYNGFRIFDEYNNQHKLENTRFVFQKTKDPFFVSIGAAFRVRLDDDYK